MPTVPFKQRPCDWHNKKSRAGGYTGECFSAGLPSDRRDGKCMQVLIVPIKPDCCSLCTLQVQSPICSSVSNLFSITSLCLLTFTRKPSFCLIVVFFLAQNGAGGKFFGGSLGLILNFAECYFSLYVSFCCRDTSQMWLSLSASLYFPHGISLVWRKEGRDGKIFSNKSWQRAARQCGSIELGKRYAGKRDSRSPEMFKSRYLALKLCRQFECWSLGSDINHSLKTLVILGVFGHSLSLSLEVFAYSQFCCVVLLFCCLFGVLVWFGWVWLRVFFLCVQVLLSDPLCGRWVAETLFWFTPKYKSKRCRVSTRALSSLLVWDGCCAWTWQSLPFWHVGQYMFRNQHFSSNQCCFPFFLFWANIWSC